MWQDIADAAAVTWLQGVARLAAVCLSISYPTLASAPHSLINGFKNLLAIAAATDVEFKEAQTIKEFLKVCIYLTCLLIQTDFLYLHLYFDFKCHAVDATS